MPAIAVPGEPLRLGYRAVPDDEREHAVELAIGTPAAWARSKPGPRSGDQILDRQDAGGGLDVGGVVHHVQLIVYVPPWVKSGLPLKVRLVFVEGPAVAGPVRKGASLVWEIVNVLPREISNGLTNPVRVTVTPSAPRGNDGTMRVSGTATMDVGPARAVPAVRTRNRGTAAARSR